MARSATRKPFAPRTTPAPFDTVGAAGLAPVASASVSVQDVQSTTPPDVQKTQRCEAGPRSDFLNFANGTETPLSSEGHGGTRRAFSVRTRDRLHMASRLPCEPRTLCRTPHETSGTISTRHGTCRLFGTTRRHEPERPRESASPTEGSADLLGRSGVERLRLTKGFPSPHRQEPGGEWPRRTGRPSSGAWNAVALRHGDSRIGGQMPEAARGGAFRRRSVTAKLTCAAARTHSCAAPKAQDCAEG